MLQGQRALVVLTQLFRCTEAGNGAERCRAEQAQLCAAMDALWENYWVRYREGIADDEQVLREILEGAVGRETVERVWARIESDEVQAALKANTDEAVTAGAFGLPWTLVSGLGDDMATQGFWGVDGLARIVESLALGEVGGADFDALPAMPLKL